MPTNETPPPSEGLATLLDAVGGPAGFLEVALAVKAAHERALAAGAVLVRDGRAGGVVAQASGDGRLLTLEVPHGALAQDVIDAVNAALTDARAAAEALRVAAAEATPTLQQLWTQRPA